MAKPDRRPFGPGPYLLSVALEAVSAESRWFLDEALRED
jgi:hypothetical protein